MKSTDSIITLAAICAAALALSACASIPGAGGDEALLKILTDPRCGHDDTIQFNAGVLSGSAARHCPIPQAAPAAVAAPVSSTP